MTTSRREYWRSAALLLLLGIMLAFLVATGAPTPASAVSTSVVISQFQVAGGTAADEFIEIHNISNANVDLNGHRVVYRSAAGTSDVSLVSWSTSTIIPAGGFFSCRRDAWL